MLLATSIPLKKACYDLPHAHSKRRSEGSSAGILGCSRFAVTMQEEQRRVSNREAVRDGWFALLREALSTADPFGASPAPGRPERAAPHGCRCWLLST